MPEQQIKLQLLWTTITPPRPPLCFLEVLGTRTMCSFQTSFLYLFLPGSPTSFSRISWCSTFVKTMLVLKHASNQQIVICQQFYITIDTKVQHWTEQVSWNYADMNDWPLTQRISAPDEFTQINMLEESFHYAQCPLLPGLWNRKSHHPTPTPTPTPTPGNCDYPTPTPSPTPDRLRKMISFAQHFCCRTLPSFSSAERICVAIFFFRWPN